MKKVEAIIRVSALDAVRDALDQRGINGLTITEVLGMGSEPGQTTQYRGVSYRIDSHHRLRLEVVLPAAEAGPVAHAIARAARTGRPGDGLVMILPVTTAVRIRTGEQGVGTVTSGPALLPSDPVPATGRTRAARRA